jgi:hypothetical protein
VRPVVRPALDPLAHRGAIQALEAQRSAYARYARSMDTHREALAAGSGDAAAAAADEAARGYDALAEGARRLGPTLAGVAGAGTEDEAAEVQRQVEAMMRAAREAETAIHNLTAQLEAWRDAYARQLSDVGLAPNGGAAAAGAPGASAAGAEPGPSAGVASGYGPRGRSSRAAAPQAPSLIDRKG